MSLFHWQVQFLALIFMVLDRLHMRVERDHHLSGASGPDVRPLLIDNRVQYFSPIAALAFIRHLSDSIEKRELINLDHTSENIG